MANEHQGEPPSSEKNRLRRESLERASQIIDVAATVDTEQVNIRTINPKLGWTMYIGLNFLSAFLIWWLGWKFAIVGILKFHIGTVLLALQAGYNIGSVRSLDESAFGIGKFFGRIYKRCRSGPVFIPLGFCWMETETRHLIQVVIGKPQVVEGQEKTYHRVTEGEHEIIHVSWQAFRITSAESDEDARTKGDALATRLTFDPQLLVVWRIRDLAVFSVVVGTIKQAVLNITETATAVLQAEAAKMTPSKMLADIDIVNNTLTRAIEILVGEINDPLLEERVAKKEGWFIEKGDSEEVRRQKEKIKGDIEAECKPKDEDDKETRQRKETAWRERQSKMRRRYWAIEIVGVNLKSMGLSHDLNKALVAKTNAAVAVQTAFSEAKGDEERLKAAGRGRADAERNLIEAKNIALEKRAEIAKDPAGFKVIALDAAADAVKATKPVIVGNDVPGLFGALVGAQHLFRELPGSEKDKEGDKPEKRKDGKPETAKKGGDK